MLSYDGGSTITYDAIGNPLTYNGYTFTWQKGRQLASASGNGKAITYKYGADGLRTEKTVDGVTTQYTYLSGLLVAQTDGTNTLRFSYTADGIPRSVNFNGTDYYYLYNLQGDVITIYNSGGYSVVDYTYDSWGKLISVTGSLASTLGALNPFRYRGYVYDTETGFYYLTTRYYDPATGRFLNADGYISTGDTISGYNMYAYCCNDPIRFKDASGNRRCDSTNTLSTGKESVAVRVGYLKEQATVIESSLPQIIGVTSSGKKVYIHNKMRYAVPAGSVKLYDCRDTNMDYYNPKEHDPNILVIDSHLIKSSAEQKEIINMMISYSELNPSKYKWERTSWSLQYEWFIHNTVYSWDYSVDSTRSTDFNNADEGKGFIVFAVERIIVRKIYDKFFK